MRRCVLSGESMPPGKMVRLVRSPAGMILPDVQGKAPGRGAWIACDGGALREAMASNRLRAALARSFRTSELAWPDDLSDRIGRALERVLLDRLGLEMRVGNLVLGSERIAAAARSGAVSALYHAADARDDGVAKLDQAWRVGLEAQGSGRGGVRLPLDRRALSVALGRENVVHLALADEAAADRVGTALARLTAFTSVHDGQPVAEERLGVETKS
jgi:predicted RNA-binding protein YlxR (DUF448 family)